MFFCPWVSKLPITPKPIQDYLDGLDTLKGFLEEMIKTHKSISDNSILSKLLEAGDSSELLSDKEIISNVWLFFLAGHETTAVAFAWELNCLRNYPDIQEKLYEEIIRVIGEDTIPKEEDLVKLQYMDCFIDEVFRLHSPVGALATREASEDVKYKDMIIPKGTRVGINFYLLHRNPEHWDEPSKFDPERFRLENRKGRNHYLHVPFSIGPRQCIGNTFSLIEQKLFLTRFLQKYRVVEPKENKPLSVDKDLNDGGKPNKVYVRIEKR
jgi:cytochrome P450